MEILVFKKLVNIYLFIYFILIEKVLKQVFSLEVRIVCSTVEPDIRLSGYPASRQMKPGIRPDTGYKKRPGIRPDRYPVQP